MESFMPIRHARVLSIAFTVVVSSVSICSAQTIEWGVKAAINASSANAVPEYYDWVRRHHAYVATGPVFGFKVGEHADSSDARLARGNPETDIYVVQILAYAAPELLRTSQTSVAVAGGWVFRRSLVEVRFTQGLQSIFKDRDGLLAGFVTVGGDEATLNRLIPQFGPFLESAKNRDLAVLAGFRF
jgi:hypothetical protein